MSASGGEVRELVGPTRGKIRNLGWSPAGQFIAYLHTPAAIGAVGELWLARANGGPPVHLRDLDQGGPHESFWWFWSANGKSLLFPSRAAEPGALSRRHLWPMTDFLPVE